MNAKRGLLEHTKNYLNAEENESVRNKRLENIEKRIQESEETLAANEKALEAM